MGQRLRHDLHGYIMELLVLSGQIIVALIGNFQIKTIQQKIPIEKLKRDLYCFINLKILFYLTIANGRITPVYFTKSILTDPTKISASARIGMRLLSSLTQTVMPSFSLNTRPSNK